MNSKLLAALDIFKALGWENATAETALQLPIGTAEQHKTFLTGIKQQGAPDWLRDHLKEEDILQNFILLAIRIGAPVNWVLGILTFPKDPILAQVMAQRGTPYLLEFTQQAAKRGRMHTHSCSRLGHISVYLVHEYSLEIPHSIDYLKDWVALTALSLEPEKAAWWEKNQTAFAPFTRLKPRLLEHIAIAIQLNLPATGPFGEVFLYAVQQGHLTRELALKQVLFALDSAVRPGDKKVWAQALETLEISDRELVANVHLLIPLIAAGEPTLLKNFAPRLIAQLENELLTELLLAALSSAQKKTQQLILKAALKKTAPQESESLAPWITLLAQSDDRTTATLAQKLANVWQITAEIAPNEDLATKGLWRPTPTLWQVPAFEIGEISQTALLDLLAELSNRNNLATDILTEKFLATTVALAYENETLARACFKGLKKREGVFATILSWLEGSPAQYLDYYSPYSKQHIYFSPLTAREAQLSAAIGKIPCLLSTPSRLDCSIWADDFMSRLQTYQKHKTPVLEADLLVALTRLDLRTVTAGTRQALQTIQLPLLSQSGEKLSKDVAKEILTFLDHPLEEPPLRLAQSNHHWKYYEVEVEAEKALPNFPIRLKQSATNDYYALFPFWGDAGLRAVKSDEHNGIVLRQVARRAQPLSPGAIINLFAVQRYPHPKESENAFMAILEAWDRGLLPPKVADVTLLDWDGGDSGPSQLAAFAVALERIAEEGLLSVVWPILDSLVVASLNAVRLLPGTAEIVALILHYVPEVQFAVEQGLTDPSAFDLPGTRSLAEQGGQSKAVLHAQKVVAAVPISAKPPQPTPALVALPSVESDSLAELWKPSVNPKKVLEDRAHISIDWYNPEDKNKQFLFTLTFPDRPKEVFQIVKKDWYFDLEMEGQIEAYRVPNSANTFQGTKENRGWLYWETSTQTLCYSPYRNQVEKTDGSRNGKRTPLSKSLLVIVITLLAQDEGSIYYIPQIVFDNIKNGTLTEYVVLDAMTIILQNPVVNPGKLVRLLEKDPKELPILWPILTQSIAEAGRLVSTQKAPPVWVNRILDIAIRHAPILKAAASEGLIPEPYAKWQGLRDLANVKGKSAAIGKAQNLLLLLGLS